MRIEYGNNEIKKLCDDEGYRTRKYGSKISTVLGFLLFELEAMVSMQPFITVPQFKKYHFEELKGSKKGICSLRLNYQYRLTFRYIDNNIEIKGLELLEVSNHYGD